MTTGTCKHGDFDLEEGCPQCIAWRREKGILPEQDELEEGLNSEGLTLLPEPTIVKVRYFTGTDNTLSGREYTYYSEEALNVGDVVIVPVTRKKLFTNKLDK